MKIRTRIDCEYFWADATGHVRPISRDMIAGEANRLWKERGSPVGSPKVDWAEAKRVLAIYHAKAIKIAQQRPLARACDEHQFRRESPLFGDDFLQCKKCGIEAEPDTQEEWSTYEGGSFYTVPNSTESESCSGSTNDGRAPDSTSSSEQKESFWGGPSSMEGCNLSR